MVPESNTQVYYNKSSIYYKKFIIGVPDWVGIIARVVVVVIVVLALEMAEGDC